ncbi:MAG: flagellar protein FlbT [Limimaricola cinnabarinus]|jgi:flagellar protein FlbT|uniref:flagellar biosynthesis repressor FlbT n=1 Tax=Limimaricola cinnabarinus TaxID=1125964 RepID=UPI0039E5DD9D
MSGLVLKLGPGERVLVNGAVIENGDRRARVSVLTPNANILRLRDAIRAEDANTPVRRVCYAAQLILAGDVTANEGHDRILADIEQLSQVFCDSDSRALLDEACRAVLDGETYRALKRLRALLPREERMFCLPLKAP